MEKFKTTPQPLTQDLFNDKYVLKYLLTQNQVLNRPCVTNITHAGSNIILHGLLNKPLNNYSSQKKPELNQTKKQNIH